MASAVTASEPLLPDTRKLPSRKEGWAGQGLGENVSVAKGKEEGRSLTPSVLLGRSLVLSALCGAEFINPQRRWQALSSSSLFAPTWNWELHLVACE